MIYARLFYVFAKLGFFTYGGGYAIIALLLGILIIGLLLPSFLILWQFRK